MGVAQQAADRAERDQIRKRWLLSAPALIIIFCAAIGPLAPRLAGPIVAKRRKKNRARRLAQTAA